MAPRDKPKRRRPGYEPAMGRPDPAEPPAEVPEAPGYLTHFPHRHGAVCGQVFTNAKYYDPVAPTCPTCSNWLQAAQRVTAARHAPLAPVQPPSPETPEAAAPEAAEASPEPPVEPSPPTARGRASGAGSKPPKTS